MRCGCGSIKGRDQDAIHTAFRKLGDGLSRMVPEYPANLTCVLHENSGDPYLVKREYRIERGEQVLRIVNRYHSAGAEVGDQTARRIGSQRMRDRFVRRGPPDRIVEGFDIQRHKRIVLFMRPEFPEPFEKCA